MKKYKSDILYQYCYFSYHFNMTLYASDNIVIYDLMASIDVFNKTKWKVKIQYAPSYKQPT